MGENYKLSVLTYACGYTSKEIENYLTEQNIEQQLSLPYSPAQNDMAKRKKKTHIGLNDTLYAARIGLTV